MPTIFEESPYVFVVSSSVKSQICHYCCRTPRCSGCQFAYYCDQDCQRSAWNDHAKECSNLAKIRPKTPTDTVRLMARCIFKERETDESSLEKQRIGRPFKELMAHVEEIQNDSIRMEHFGYVVAMLKAYIGERSLPPVSELLEMYGKICINSFSIVNDEGQTIGVGIYSDISQLDHSCDPDAIVVFDGSKAILNWIKSDVPGEVDLKTTKISYIELMHPSSERQRQLKEQYYFQCTCDRCADKTKDQLMEALKCSTMECDGYVVMGDDEEGASGSCQKCGTTDINIDDGITMMQRVRWQLENLDSLQKEQDYPSEYAQATTLSKEASTVLHSVNIHLIRLGEHAFDAAIQLENWSQAVEHGKAILAGYRVHYPRGHPSVTYRLAQIGKMLLFLGQLEEAELFLQQALAAVKISHGIKHPLHETIAELLSNCQEERRVQLSDRQLAEISGSRGKV